MTKLHEGKVAVITGAAMGIGRAYAERLGSEGARVVCVDRLSSAETVQRIERGGGSAIELLCDVGDPDEVGRMEAEVLSRLGGCDILVNNAGISPARSFDEISFEDWRRVMSINLDSQFLTAKAFVPGMRGRKWGRIVNQASDSVALVLTGLVHYIASKTGIIGFTRALATELGNDGITVNAIAPGLIRTPGTEAQRGGPNALPNRKGFDMAASQQAIKRPLTTEDLCGALSFICSDGAAMLTGQTIYLNGGHTRT